MNYETIYEVTSENMLNLYDFVPVFMAIAGIYMFIDALRNKGEDKDSSNLFTAVWSFSFGIIFTVFSFFSLPNSIKKYNDVMQIYQENQYETVEGKIENFESLLKRGIGRDSFTVSGIAFKYSDYLLGGYYGFHNTASHGGPITGNGQEFRIGFITEANGDNIILKIEKRLPGRSDTIINLHNQTLPTE
jgi:hypothetical protein